jgi:hypothetical protein
MVLCRVARDVSWEGGKMEGSRIVTIGWAHSFMVDCLRNRDKSIGQFNRCSY